MCINRSHFSRLYRRLQQSPAYRRTGGVYLHEEWFRVIGNKYFGLSLGK